VEIDESAVNTPQTIFFNPFDSFIPTIRAKMKFRVLKQWLLPGLLNLHPLTGRENPFFIWADSVDSLSQGGKESPTACKAPVSNHPAFLPRPTAQTDPIHKMGTSGAGRVPPRLIQDRETGLCGMLQDRTEPVGALAAKGIGTCRIKGEGEAFARLTSAQGFILEKFEIVEIAPLDPLEKSPDVKR
jgi:hypothetical protein